MELYLFNDNCLIKQAVITGDERRDDKWQDEHLQHPHKDFSRKTDESYRLRRKIGQPTQKTETQTHQNSSDSQYQKHVTSHPLYYLYLMLHAARFNRFVL